MSTLSLMPTALLDVLSNNLPLTIDQRATLYTLVCDAAAAEERRLQQEARDAFDTLPDDYEVG